MPTYEVLQATGAQTRIAYCKEADWGVSPTTGYKLLNIVGGESLDDAISTYQSNVIRADRMRNPTVRGTRRPGGGLPIEMAPKGISQFLWHLLGGTPTVTPGPVVATNETQTITLTSATGGSYTLTLAGKTTSSLAYNVNNTAIQTALEAIVGVGNVTVSGASSPYTVTFTGALSGMDVGALSPTSNLTGTTPTITVAAGVSPVRGIGAGKYKHVFTGATSLPTGFTLEKGFLDLAVPKYFAYKGCRVGRFSMSANIDQIVTASLDILAREASAPSSTSVMGANVPTAAPAVSPFTSIQAGIYRDGVQLSVCQNLALNIDNSLNSDAFVLGSNYRSSLKPGSRRVDGNASFLFQDTDFYDAAVNGSNLSMKVLLADALGNSIEFLMPVVQLLPNNSSPKIDSDGPLSIPANFEALPDTGISSDIQITIISDEATINY